MSLRACLLGAFLLLQSADVVLTWLLLTTRPDVGEANPLALAVLQRHGWPGAVALKLGCTLVAVGSVLLVSRKRPALGRGLVIGLCAVMATVVGYSGVLLAGPPDADYARMKDTERMAAALDRQWEDLRALQRQRDGLCAELLAGRVALPDAVRQMTDELAQRRPRLHRRGQPAWPRPERPEEVARFLVRFCEELPRREGRAAALRGLRRELAGHYPAPPRRGGPAVLMAAPLAR